MGRDQYHTHVSQRLVDQTKPITGPVQKNDFPLFGRAPARETSRARPQLSSLQNDCSLFSRLFGASHMRDDLNDSFAHEHQACPATLSQVDNMRLDKNFDLVGCLEDMVPPQENVGSPHVEVLISDGAAVATCWRVVVRRPSLSMPHRLSCCASRLSQSGWLSPGMNTCQAVWRLTLEQRKVQVPEASRGIIFHTRRLAGLPAARRGLGGAVLLPSDETKYSRGGATGHQHSSQRRVCRPGRNIAGLLHVHMKEQAPGCCPAWRTP